MNDFTKEELNIIYDYIKEINRKYEVTDEMEHIENKVKLVIDNYCEHEFYVNGCGENAFGQCHKCGEVRRLQRNDNQ